MARSSALKIALVGAAVMLVYWPAIHGGFIWDDELLITRNVLVKASDGLYRMWFTQEPIDYWPLTNSTFWIEWRLWGMNSTGYHITNVVLHACSSTLVWTVLRRLEIPGAFLAALIFAVHPVNVESVAWIAQRKNTLSLLFFLIALLLYLKSTNASRHSRMLYWSSVAAFLLAMLSKGSVVVLPIVLMIVAWWRQRRITTRDLILAAPFVAIGVALTIVNIWFQTHGSQHEIRDLTLLQRLLGAGAVPWFYLYKALLPLGLVFVYPQWNVDVGNLLWWLPLTATLAVTGVMIWRSHHPVIRALLFAWLYYCVALLPVMGFTDVYYMKYSLVADHYQYIAIIAICGLIGWVGTSRTSATSGTRAKQTGRAHQKSRPAPKGTGRDN